MSLAWSPIHIQSALSNRGGLFCLIQSVMAERGPNRKDPWMKLFVSDFAGDERLRECSASATGVFIRLMCLMHISEPYGRICCSKQGSKMGSKCYSSIDFAKKVSTQLPYELAVVNSGIQELVDNGVLYIDGDTLCQKRMIRDFEKYLVKSGAASGIASAVPPAIANGVAKMIAPSNSNSNSDSVIDVNEKERAREAEIQIAAFEDFRQIYPGRHGGYKTELSNFQRHKDWQQCLEFLGPALESELHWREAALQTKKFVPEWAHMKTWINQRRWEQTLPKIEAHELTRDQKFELARHDARQRDADSALKRTVEAV